MSPKCVLFQFKINYQNCHDQNHSQVRIEVKFETYFVLILNLYRTGSRRQSYKQNLVFKKALVILNY